MKLLDQLFGDTVVGEDPIANLPVTAGMIRHELDLIDVRLRAIARFHRKNKPMLAEREALERRKMALQLRIPR